MKALADHGPRVRLYEEKPVPIIQESINAIVRMTKTTICGTDLHITTRLVDTVTAPMLLKTVFSGKLQTKQLITHHFTLDEVMQAYDTFDDAMKEEALKVIILNKILSDKVKSASAAPGKAALEEQSFKEELIVNDSLGG